mgnify:CR=1 FL=1
MKKIMFILLMALALNSQAKEVLKFIIPNPPGGSGDIITRLIQKNLEDKEDLDIQIVYKPGGFNMVAVNESIVDKSDYVVVLSGPAIYYNSMENEDVAKIVNRMIPVANVASVPTALYVNKNSKFKTFQQMYEYSKNNYVNIGSSNIMGKYVVKEIFPADSKTTIVFYAGDAPTSMAVLSNTVDLGMSLYPSITKFTTTKEVEVLGITQRNTDNIPYVKSMHGDVFIGYFAPPSMSVEKVKKINRWIAESVNTKEYIDTITKLGARPVDNSQESFVKTINNIMKK